MPEPSERAKIRTTPLSVLLLNGRASPDGNQGLAAWCEKLDGLGQDYEVLLVTEGGEPEADPAKESLASRFPKVRLLSPLGGQGPGTALRAAVAAARHPLFFYTDCAYPFQPVGLSLLLDRIDDVDLVSGYCVPGPVPGWLRGLGFVYRGLARVLVGLDLAPLPGWPGWEGLAYHWLVRLLYGVRLHGVDRPFRLFRRAIFARIPIQSDGPFAHVEVVAKANFLGCLMDEAKVPYRPHPPGQAPLARYPLRQTLAEMRRILSDPDFGPAVLPAGAPSADGVSASAEASRPDETPTTPV